MEYIVYLTPDILHSYDENSLRAVNNWMELVLRVLKKVWNNKNIALQKAFVHYVPSEENDYSFSRNHMQATSFMI